ncbi:hypothetical protein WA026_023342 [Henosepilachna vigintioctopunctata]|uniref:Uncharacterized protein n=1 Tax=Henosepilachna vigintioctopunctata TaxID=420089 RepID=A0AAW1VJG5_9CUCU
MKLRQETAAEQVEIHKPVKPTLKLKDLPSNTVFPITNAYLKKGKFGTAIVSEMNDQFVYLPQRSTEVLKKFNYMKEDIYGLKVTGLKEYLPPSVLFEIVELFSVRERTELSSSTVVDWCIQICHLATPIVGKVVKVVAGKDPQTGLSRAPEVLQLPTLKAFALIMKIADKFGIKESQLIRTRLLRQHLATETAQGNVDQTKKM